jgi:hypothetical protein
MKYRQSSKGDLASGKLKVRRIAVTLSGSLEMKAVFFIFVYFFSLPLYASKSSYDKDFLRCMKAYAGTFTGSMDFRDTSHSVSVTLTPALVAVRDQKTGQWSKGPLTLGTFRVCATDDCFKNDSKSAINMLAFQVVGEFCSVDVHGQSVLEVHSFPSVGGSLSLILRATKDGVSAESSLNYSRSNLARR